MDDSLVEILELCMAIEDSARLVYAKLAQDEPNDDLRAFWAEMSAEEKEHLGYWQRLLAMALEGLVPQLFDDPLEVIQELNAALRSVQQLCAEGSTAPEVHRRFLLAYHLEFHALHPAAIPLMAYLGEISGEPIQQGYERHVNGFFRALEAHAGSTPELAVIAKMIERLWRLALRLQNEAHIDLLTGLRNRRGFLAALRPLVHLAKRRGETVGFLWVDVDELKAVNDSAGHPAGDEALLAVAGVLVSVVRQSDVACRLGGDEFGVFLSSAKPAYVEAVAERVRAAVEEAGRGASDITVSVGATYGPVDGDPADVVTDLMHRSDACLYEAKEGGRNRVLVRGPADEAS